MDLFGVLWVNAVFEQPLHPTSLLTGKADHHETCKEQVGKGGLPPLALPNFNQRINRVGQRGQATLPDLFFLSVVPLIFATKSVSSF